MTGLETVSIEREGDGWLVSCSCATSPIPRGFRGKMALTKSDPARCVNTICAGPRRTGLEFD